MRDGIRQNPGKGPAELERARAWGEQLARTLQERRDP
jgi:hypothetical protein